MTLTFSQIIVKTMPTWLKRTNGAALVGGIAKLFSDRIDNIRYAATSQLLQLTSSPDDVLPFVGNERRILRFPGESADSYRTRLRNAWSTHSFGGSHTAIRDQIDAFFGGVATPADILVESARTWQRDERFHPKTLLPWWSRFWVYVPYSIHAGSLTTDQKTTLKAIVRQWKPARWRCDGVILGGTGSTVGVDMVVNLGENFGASEIGGTGGEVLTGV